LLPIFRKVGLVEEQIVLPLANDHNTHSTEILIPTMGNGTYLVFAAGKNATKGYAYGFFQVTGLTLSKTDFDKYSVYCSLDRTTGEPLKDVKVELHFRNASTLVYRTDYNGE